MTSPTGEQRPKGTRAQSRGAEADVGHRPARDASRQAAAAPHPLSGLDIVVLAPPETDILDLIRELQRLRARVRQEWPPPDPFPREADVVLGIFSPGLANRLPWLPGEAPLALVLIIDSHGQPDYRQMLNCAPHGVLARPMAVQGALACIVLARNLVQYEQRLRLRIEKLDENLRNVRNVERAKAYLMRQRNLGEEEAYRFLRQHAMERRVSIGAVAALVVDSVDLLG